MSLLSAYTSVPLGSGPGGLPKSQRGVGTLCTWRVDTDQTNTDLLNTRENHKFPAESNDNFEGSLAGLNWFDCVILQL